MSAPDRQRASPPKHLTHSLLFCTLSHEGLRYNMKFSRKRFLLLLSVGLAVLLPGCAGLETQLSHANDPKSIAGTFLALLVTAFCLPFLLGSTRFPATKNFHDALLWTGCAAIATSPLYWISTGSIQAAGATASGGALAIALCLTVLKSWAEKKQD